MPVYFELQKDKDCGDRSEAEKCSICGSTQSGSHWFKRIALQEENDQYSPEFSETYCCQVCFNAIGELKRLSVDDIRSGFILLDQVRGSGELNMMWAPVIVREGVFLVHDGERMTKMEAQKLATLWMRTYARRVSMGEIERRA